MPRAPAIASPSGSSPAKRRVDEAADPNGPTTGSEVVAAALLAPNPEQRVHPSMTAASIGPGRWHDFKTMSAHPLAFIWTDARTLTTVRSSDEMSEKSE